MKQFLDLLAIALFAAALLSQQADAANNKKCGGPLVSALETSDKHGLLNGKSGTSIQASINEISRSNLEYYETNAVSVRSLQGKEKQLYDKITQKYLPPIVHRTTFAVVKHLLTSGGNISSPAQRGANPKTTPGVEQQLFAAEDCIFASIGPKYGISKYGKMMIKLQNNKGYFWASRYTGYTYLEDRVGGFKKGDPVNNFHKQRYSEQIFSSSDYAKFMALQVLDNIDNGSSARGKGRRYNKATILDDLLKINDYTSFWHKITDHDLTYLEAKYIGPISLNEIEYFSIHKRDEGTVKGWGLPNNYFTGNHTQFGPLIRFFGSK